MRVGEDHFGDGADDDEAVEAVEQGHKVALEEGIDEEFLPMGKICQSSPEIQGCTSSASSPWRTTR